FSLPEVDYIFSGEGERSFALLADALEEGVEPSEVLGCSFRKADGSLFVSSPCVEEEDPPSPILGGYVDALKGRIAYLESSRGCPFSCAFCLSGRVGGVRFFDLERVKRDILTLVAGGSKTVKFVDRTFNANGKRAREIFSFLLAQRGKAIPKDVCFHFEMSGELLDEETLALLKTVPKGYFQMELGVQSLHGETLAAIHRSSQTEKLQASLRTLLSVGNIHTHLDLIAGLPKEDLATFEKSFDGVFALRPHMLQLGFLKLLRGAPMREERETYPCAFAEEAPYTVLSTPCLSAEELSVITLAEKGCDRLYNSRRYLETVELLLRNTPFSPFRLFAFAGEKLASLPAGYTLNDEVALLFNTFCGFVEKDRLLDALRQDYVESNSSGHLPPVLRMTGDEERARYKKILSALPKAKGRRSLVLLSTGEALLAEYGEKDPVTGRYGSRVL
ncbi:MAG: DUF4080 domain-containing protein, partial [Clostridia bacterium]|nr:DUF4080 domain-containing protein [Clostridia bacterium]